MGTDRTELAMSEMESKKTCRHYHVFGRVQGVWYRGTARERARELGLQGWVRNCADGTVEAVACGTPEALDAFRSWLHEGPPAARVDRVEESDASEMPVDQDFVIKH